MAILGMDPLWTSRVTWPTRSNSECHYHASTTGKGVTNKELDALLRSFWEIESLGIQMPTNDPVLDQFTSPIQMKGG